MTGENCRRRLKNQAQEASFQYLANIVLCNIGAGAALSALERTPLRHHRGARLGALIGGITAVGVLGGSAIANFIGKNLLGPMLEEGPIGGLRATVGRVRTEGVASLWRGLNDQRHIEATDVALHADDFAVAGFSPVLNGLRPCWPCSIRFRATAPGWGIVTARRLRQP